MPVIVPRSAAAQIDNRATVDRDDQPPPHELVRERQDIDRRDRVRWRHRMFDRRDGLTRAQELDRTRTDRGHRNEPSDVGSADDDASRLRRHGQRVQPEDRRRAEPPVGCARVRGGHRR